MDVPRTCPRRTVQTRSLKNRYSAALIKGACEPWSTICCESRAFFQVMNKVEQVAALTPPVLSNFQGQAGWCRNELSTDDSAAVMLG